MQGYSFPGGNLHPITDQCGDTKAWSPCLTWNKGVSLALELSVGLAEASVATALLLNFTLCPFPLPSPSQVLFPRALLKTSTINSLSQKHWPRTFDTRSEPRADCKTGLGNQNTHLLACNESPNSIDGRNNDSSRHVGCSTNVKTFIRVDALSPVFETFGEMIIIRTRNQITVAGDHQCLGERQQKTKGD